MTDPVKKNVVQITQSTNTITIASSGPQGPKGQDGINGISGGSYTFEQQTNSATWNITHNLGFRPSVTVQDYGKITLEGDLSHTDANSLVLTFSQAVSGYAYLS
jgi:hypothetical protein